jgi:putative tricarboxylic transport membrane protein
MKTRDLVSGSFWFLLSTAGIIESFRMGIGTMEQPGMGFMPFAASGLLCALSLLLLVRAAFKKEEGAASGSARADFPVKALIVLITLVIYAVIIPRLGYLIITFLLMPFLFGAMERNGRKGLIRSAIISLITAVASYYLFAVLLKCPFPAGILGF